MSWIEIVLIGFSLAMDAVAVNMINGITNGKRKNIIWITSITFALFQAVMPLIGYFTGKAFYDLIKNIDHWIALILLLFIGGKMLYDAFKKEEEKDEKLSFKIIIIQGVATSIDALAIGISFAALNVNIWLAVSLIAVSTFVLVFAAFLIGKKFGNILADKAKIIGGLILIIIGIKIFVEHIFF